jgi:hypothetical protein
MLDESTQTNWNGILGRIELQTEEMFAIQGVSVGSVAGRSAPDAHPHSHGGNAGSKSSRDGNVFQVA